MICGSFPYKEKRFSFYPKVPTRNLFLASLPFNEYHDFSPRVRWLEREPEHCISSATEGRQEVRRLEEELDKDAVCHQFCSACTTNALPRKHWKGLETSKQEGKSFTLCNMQMDSCYWLMKEMCYRT